MEAARDAGDWRVGCPSLPTGGTSLLEDLGLLWWAPDVGNAHPPTNDKGDSRCLGSQGPKRLHSSWQVVLVFWRFGSVHCSWLQKRQTIPSLRVGEVGSH